MSSNVYPHAVRYAALVKSVVTTDGTKTEELAPFQMGVVNPKTFQTVGESSKLKSIRVVVGSPNNPKESVSYAGFYDKFNRKVSQKSMELKNIIPDSFYANVPREAKGFEGYFGGIGEWGGETIDLKPGEANEFGVQVYGPIVERLYGKFQVNEKFTVNVPDDFVPSTDDPRPYLWSLVRQMNDPRMGHNKVRRFGKFSLVSPCATNPWGASTTMYIHQVEICDSGDDLALAMVKSAVDFSVRNQVKRVKRVGTTSTYEVCSATADLGSFTFAAMVEEQQCGTCEAGDTAVVSKDVYKSTVPVGDATYTTLVADPASSLIGIVGTEATFYSYVDAGTTWVNEAAIILVGTTEVIGTNTAYCIGAETNYTWVQVDTEVAYSRNLSLEVRLQCGEDNTSTTDYATLLGGLYTGILTDITATNIETAGEGVPIPVSDCWIKVTAVQASPDCIGADCDSTDASLVTFPEVAPFRGIAWIEDEPTFAAYSSDCTFGIKVTSNPINCNLGGCSYDPNEFAEYDVPMFKIYTVNDINLYERDTNGNFIAPTPDLDPKWRVSQRPAVMTLDGHSIINEILLYRAYRGEVRYSPSEAYSAQLIAAEGNVHGIQPCQKYYVLHLMGDYGEVSSLSSSFGDKLEDIMLIFENRTVLEDAVAVLAGFAEKHDVSLTWG